MRFEEMDSITSLSKPLTDTHAAFVVLIDKFTFAGGGLDGQWLQEDVMRFEEMDSITPFSKQLTDTSPGPVVLINKFSVAFEDRDALVLAWADDAAFFKRQPGFISAQLHRGVGDSTVFLNYAVWESVAAFRDAFEQSKFRSHLAQYPASVVASPHLFETVAVPGICLGWHTWPPERRSSFKWCNGIAYVERHT